MQRRQPPHKQPTTKMHTQHASTFLHRLHQPSNRRRRHPRTTSIGRSTTTTKQTTTHCTRTTTNTGVHSTSNHSSATTTNTLCIARAAEADSTTQHNGTTKKCHPPRTSPPEVFTPHRKHVNTIQLPATHGHSMRHGLTTLTT